MPAAKPTKCGVCKENIAKAHKRIKCISCKFLLHLHCADVSEEHFALVMDKPSISFTCAVCLSSCSSDRSLHNEICDLKNCFNKFC